MVNIDHALDASEAHAIDRYFETQGTNIITVASMGFQVLDKLTATIDADVILLTAYMTIFSDVLGLTVRTVHRRLGVTLTQSWNSSRIYATL